MLLAGRNVAPLTTDEQTRASNVFLGLDGSVNVRYEESAKTAFHVRQDDQGHEYGEIVFGPDIYPGRSIVDANSMLSLEAAAAHELTHFHRWREKRELPAGVKTHLDEALTSLESAGRYQPNLTVHDIRVLASDAAQRISLYVAESEKLPTASS